MLEASFLLYFIFQAKWFYLAHRSYNMVRGDELDEKHFIGLNPDNDKVEARQWLCFHFARTFFLAEHGTMAESFSSAAWNQSGNKRASA
mmetsp:Transcript_64262/g.161829  ORF Transcript_64262/g.161829 Transcript_64262/m.161829 type:complete len:89 (+) Transcript_64262:3-269(+)